MPVLSRRDWLTAAAAVSASAPLFAKPQAASPSTAEPDDPRAQIAKHAQALRAIPLNQLTEPAFEFKV